MILTRDALKHALLLLLAGLAMAAQAQDALQPAPELEAWRDKARELRARAEKLRQAAAAERAAAEKACWEKFLVSDCLARAREAEREAEREARALDIEAGRLERRAQAVEREERVRRRQAEKAAEIERRRAQSAAD